MKLSTVLSTFKLTANSTKKINARAYLFLLFFLGVTTASISQSKTQGFTLSKYGFDDVILYKSIPATNTWQVVGSTDRSNIRSLAADSDNRIIYAVDGGKLGRLDPNSAKFSSIGEIGTGNGERGQINIDNIYAIALDKNRNILYATHRMDGLDLLLQINPTTGKIISNSMVNASGKRVDYKTISIKTFYLGQNFISKKFVDLTYDNEQKMLFIVHNHFDIMHAINSFTNIDAQAPKEEFRQSPIKNLAAIAYDEEGKLFATFSNNKISGGNPFSGGGVIINLGDLTTIYPGLTKYDYFYGLDFFVAPACANDLALLNSPTTSAPQKAKYTISSSALIKISTKFIAGESVNLNNNFEVKKSVNFDAYIDGDACK